MPIRVTPSPDDGSQGIGEEAFQGVHVADDHGQDVAGLPVLEKGQVQGLEVAIKGDPDVVAGALGHGGQGVVRAALEQGQEQEGPQHGQAEPDIDAGSTVPAVAASTTLPDRARGSRSQARARALHTRPRTTTRR